MKASDPFKKAIKEHLDNRAATDELFAVTYAKKNKNLDECCKYIMEQAKKGGLNGYADEEVFNWAVHYYDEDSIKNVKGVHGTVIVNRAVELSPEELEKVKASAIELATQQKTQEIKKDLIVDVKLSEEEIAEAKLEAISKIHEEARNKMMEKKVAKSKPKAQQTASLNLESSTDPNGQSSLF